VEYAVTLSVTITQIEPGLEKTVVRTVSTGSHAGVQAAKTAYDEFLRELRDCAYTESIRTEENRSRTSEGFAG